MGVVGVGIIETKCWVASSHRCGFRLGVVGVGVIETEYRVVRIRYGDGFGLGVIEVVGF